MSDQPRAEPKRLRLTPLGEFVMQHSVMTPTSWWQETIRDAKRYNEMDADYLLMLDERIAGLTELRERFFELAYGSEGVENDESCDDETATSATLGPDT